MPMHTWGRLRLGLPAFALALGLSGSLASPFPIGSYDSDAYTLTFDSTGVFRYLNGDHLMVQGEYVVHDSTMSLTDEKGIDACVGSGRNPGTYRWKLVGNVLWFHSLHDPCADRIRGLAEEAWQPHRAR
jgi:hypothetical protein